MCRARMVDCICNNGPRIKAIERNPFGIVMMVQQKWFAAFQDRMTARRRCCDGKIPGGQADLKRSEISIANQCAKHVWPERNSVDAMLGDIDGGTGMLRVPGSMLVVKADEPVQLLATIMARIDILKPNVRIDVERLDGARGVASLREDGWRLVAEGRTTVAEVSRVVSEDDAQ